MQIDPHRIDLLEIFQAALKAVHGTHVVSEFLESHEAPAPVYLIAIGKAAAAMTEGAYQALGGAIRQSLVITKHGHMDEELAQRDQLRYVEAGHPVPDQASLRAGLQLLAFIQAIPENCQLLFLLSGGASSLAEVPLETIGLAQLQRVNNWLLGSGFDIESINRVRKHLSQIKGGGLLRFLQNRRVCALLVSDVQDDNLSSIGSGLLVEQAYDELKDLKLPKWMQPWFTDEFIESPGPAELHLHVVANLEMAKTAAAAHANALGYSVVQHEQFIDGEAFLVGRTLAREMISGSIQVHVWGGESTVVLPEHPGRGGRSQSLALAAAIELKGHRNHWFLAAGTDGSDGPGTDAGALVDGYTLSRAGEMDPISYLERADAGTFLLESGDLIHCGPTGTNVMDLMIGLKIAE